MNNNGYIKLHRSLLNWEWYRNSKTKDLFLHLLLTVNWKEGNFLGFEVKRGQRICSRRKLSKETGMSEQTIREALNRLVKTGELILTSSKTFTLITIVNYENFQAEIDVQNNNPVYNPQNNPVYNPPKNSENLAEQSQKTSIKNSTTTQLATHKATQFTTTIEEIKEIKEIKEDIERGTKVPPRTCTRKLFIKPSVEDISLFIKENGLTINAEYFFNYYESNGWLVGRNKMKDWKATLRKWQIREKTFNRPKNNTNDFFQCLIEG